MTSNYWSRIRKCSRFLPPSLLRGPLRLAAVELLLLLLLLPQHDELVWHHGGEGGGGGGTAEVGGGVRGRRRRGRGRGGRRRRHGGGGGRGHGGGGGGDGLHRCDRCNGDGGLRGGRCLLLRCPRAALGRRVGGQRLEGHGHPGVEEELLDEDAVARPYPQAPLDEVLALKGEAGAELDLGRADLLVLLEGDVATHHVVEE